MYEQHFPEGSETSFEHGSVTTYGESTNSNPRHGCPRVLVQEPPSDQASPPSTASSSSIDRPMTRNGKVLDAIPEEGDVHSVGSSRRQSCLTVPSRGIEDDMHSILEGTQAPPVSTEEISVSDHNVLDTENEHGIRSDHSEIDQVASALNQTSPVTVSSSRTNGGSDHPAVQTYHPATNSGTRRGRRWGRPVLRIFRDIRRSRRFE